MTQSTPKTLIIGASGGIGQAVTKSLAAQGRSLILCGRSHSSLDKMSAGMNSIELLEADITTQEGRAVITNRMQQNDIDTLINLAGINEMSAFTTQSPESIERIINTNLTSTMLLTHSILAISDKQKNLSIINVGSTLGAIGIPGYVTYCASKFALRGFCQALSRELADTAIKIKYFAPRTTETSMNSDTANAMNQELGNKADSAEHVASQLLDFIKSSADNLHIGWPEKLFVKINGAFPSVVSKSLKKQLPIIQKYID